MPMDVLTISQVRWSVGPTAYQFSKTLQELLYEAQESLEKVSRRIKKYADEGKRPPKYRVGDRVMLKLIP